MRVVRETCETAGDMDTNLAPASVVEQPPPRFPYANWGPGAAVGGVLAALAAGVVIGIPGAVIGQKPHGGLTTFGNVFVQLATALGFLLVPMALAAMFGARDLPQILRRLGLRGFRPSALIWMALAIVVYLVAYSVYAQFIVQPHQTDIAEGFGAVPVQVLLIVFAAPISEEVCFRGMLFGGLRERLPRVAAALITGLIFGGLHAISGVTAVPPLMLFGFLLSLLYEKTGSIVPGILLHMLNNSAALLGQ